MTTTRNSGPFGKSLPSSNYHPADEGVASLFAAANLPVGRVEFIASRSALKDALDQHLQDYIARSWSDYKAQLHDVAASGGADDAPVPSEVGSLLCLLDEAAVAMVSDAWHQAFRLGMSLAGAEVSGAVAVRLPDMIVCPRCRGEQVIAANALAQDDSDCQECDGAGVVTVTPDLLVLGGAVGVVPLPVRVVRT